MSQSSSSAARRPLRVLFLKVETTNIDPDEANDIPTVRLGANGGLGAVESIDFAMEERLLRVGLSRVRYHLTRVRCAVGVFGFGGCY